MYQAIIGLECHAQLDTASKLFCRCRVTDGEPPNTHVCPVCLGHPGTLPVANAQAVELAVRAALALSCTVHGISVFARKQYFYPDLPKGYQISQYEEPLATGGRLHVELDGERRFVGITRIHLEEDSGKSIHGEVTTGVDFNRAGVPLIEIVSEPDLRTPREAEAAMRMLHRVLVEAAVTRGDMEKGHFRCDANVSVHHPGAPWGTKVEIKNVNSFRFVARALAHEVDRQERILERGGSVVQETRSWRGDRTASARAKEGSSDYRYFPDPDLPPLQVDDALLGRARKALPGVPLDLWLQKRDAREHEAFRERHGLDDHTAEVLLRSHEPRAFFEAAVAAGGDGAQMARWITGEVLRRINEGEVLADARLSPEALVALQGLVADGTLSHSMAREVFGELWARGGEPREIVVHLGMHQITDEALLGDLVRDIVARHPRHVERYRAGNERMVGFFMGQVMKATGGRADPALASRLVVEAMRRV
jgi:aspartyl-tRNA(Asn)/glutamyl-tRNA(Gln) amidotransferase subunit B